jgi:hypothetical protein
MRRRKMFNVLAVVAGCLLLVGGAHAQEASRGKQRDYLKVVKAYAETLMERGRDTYGAKKTPLFVASLDRKNLQPGNFPGIAGIRAHDRSLHCANPMHDENLYQVLYALTKIIGDKKYATEADKALKFFFENCQSPATGLMAWGEHMGWHIHGERPQTEMRFRGRPLFMHEFYRPWILWDRCHKLAPDAALKFSKGVWEHQIANHKTGEFSRHAQWDKHGPGGGNEYPRHGGFYILAWAGAAVLLALTRSSIPSVFYCPGSVKRSKESSCSKSGSCWLCYWRRLSVWPVAAKTRRPSRPRGPTSC